MNFEVVSSFDAGHGLTMIQCRQTPTIDGLLQMHINSLTLLAESCGGSSPLDAAVTVALEVAAQHATAEGSPGASLLGANGGLRDVPMGTPEYSTVRKALGYYFGDEYVLCVKSLQAVKNAATASRYKAYVPPIAGVGAASGGVRFLVHGTSLEKARSIAAEGFKLPTEVNDEGQFMSGEASLVVESFLGHGMGEFLRFGGGIYFTSEAIKAAMFAQAPDEEPAMIICAVKLGRLVELQEDDIENTKLSSAIACARGFDSVFHQSDGETKDEYVVYSSSAVLPLYVATYHTVKPRRIAFFLKQQEQLQQGSSSTSLLPESAAQKAYGELSAAFQKRSDPTITGDSNLHELFCTIGDVAQQGGVNAARLAFLERNSKALLLLAKGLSVSCEFTQWQALRALSNYTFESSRRQAQVYEHAFAEVFRPLHTLLSSSNEAVVQKATFLACNLTSHHPPPDGDEGRRLITKLVDALMNANETMTIFYTSAALTNAIKDGKTAELARPVVEAVLDELDQAQQLALWVEWTVNMIRNYIQVGDQKATMHLVHNKDLGRELASMLQRKRVLKSVPAVEAVSNCLSWVVAGKIIDETLKSIIDEFIEYDGAKSLAAYLESIGKGGKACYAVAQALSYVYHSQFGTTPDPETRRVVASCFKQARPDVEKAYLAKVLALLSNHELLAVGVKRDDVDRQIAQDKARDKGVMGLSKLSLADFN